MTAKFSFDANNIDVQRVLKKLNKLDRNSKQVLVRGINNAVKSARAKVSTEIRKDIAPRPQGQTPKQYVDSRLKIFSATTEILTAKVVANSRGILLTRFSHKAAPKSTGGVYVKVKPSGARRLLPKAFIVNNLKNSGVSGIAVNIGGRKIKVLYGPSVSQVMAVELPKLQESSAPILQKAVLREARAAARGVGIYG